MIRKQKAILVNKHKILNSFNDGCFHTFHKRLQCVITVGGDLISKRNLILSTMCFVVPRNRTVNLWIMSLTLYLLDYAFIALDSAGVTTVAQNVVRDGPDTQLRRTGDGWRSGVP